jgi:membrane-bound lytic murein transglycosylase C
MATEKAVGYAMHPKALQRDIQRFASLVEDFRDAVAGVWGKEEVKGPRTKEYVKYTQNYRSRASVNFDNGIIAVETLDPDHPLLSLKNAIVTTLLTPDDPRTVDLFSAEPVKLGARPFLYKEVKDHTGKYVRWSWRAKRFADHLIQNRLQTRTIRAKGKDTRVHYVRFSMVKDHHQVRAKKYKPLVERSAKRFYVSKNLVYAIIKTESDFNPYAVSSAPAFGLMQIVPGTAGQDVYRFLNKRDGYPSREELFVPANNITYGSAYLHLLDDRYLLGIRNPVSREYCVIAAYNGGAGSVLGTFDEDRTKAVSKINSLAPGDVYRRLRGRLPSPESRRYLGKVIHAQKEFVSF